MPERSCEQTLRSPLCRLAELGATLVGLGRRLATRRDLEARDLERRLTCCWVLALGLVGAGVIAAVLVTVDIVVHQRDEAWVIAEAGTQRSRAQRIASFLADLATDDPVEQELARLELARIRGRMEEVFRRLAAGPEAPAHHSPALRAHYFEGPLALDPRLARFLAELGALLRDAEEGLVVGAEQVAPLRREALGPLLGLLDEAVRLHEDDVREAIDRLLLASFGVGGAILVLLLAIGLGIFRPMTRGLAAFVADLERLAEQDPLTGVANRRALVAALERAIAARTPLAAIAIDLDHFKEANERAGHAGGDALLRAAAERLRGCVRTRDIVGRIGGDEFVVFLLEVREEESLRPIVERIRAVLHEPVAFEGRLLPLGATLGVALCPADTDDPELLLRVADEALVRAKHEQRGSIGRARREDVLAVELARELRALAEPGREAPPDGLAPVFQPVVALGLGPRAPLLGFEALARWRHPRLGSIPPAQLFAGGADRRGVVAIGRLLRRAALSIFADLLPSLPAEARLSVNLAPAEVFDDGLADAVLADLASLGLPPDRLVLEITEDVLLDRVSDQRLAGLLRLRARGVGLALDDFGTGTSGLAQLLRLPFDVVKIDRRFVQALGEGAKAAEIVRATMALARSLELTVVAEGVESEAQARLLQSLGCGAAQGHWLAPPMDAAGLEAWLRDRVRAECRRLDRSTAPAAGALAAAPA